MDPESFTLDVDGRRVPGVVFWPRAAGRRVPLILAQHGGSSHKLGQEILDWAALFTDGHGIALAALDGPVHGARRAGGADGASREQTRADFFAVWEAPGSGIDAMIADWRATLDHLCADARIDTGAIGWLGVSMGTAYGLPLVAAEPRIRAAVLGMWGLSFPNSARLAVDAAAIRQPVLFQQKWGDELFTREGQLQLFDALGGNDKWLCTYPGGHVRVEGRQLRDLETFLLEHLGAA